MRLNVVKPSVAVAYVLAVAALVGGSSDTILLRNGEQVQHIEFEGHSRWKLIPHLWTDKAINITCRYTKDFKVFTASSVDTLQDKVERQESVWCGWRNFLGQNSCVARLSPFGKAHLIVTHDVPTSAPCQVELSEQVSLVMIAQTLAGALLFLNASKLSASVFFRLGTGSAGVMMLSVIILLFLLSRTLPSKKSAAALFAIFGSSFTGMVRFVFGQWIPSFEQLVCNKVFLIYMAVSGLLGLALTYYYDREDNFKLHNILKYGLKLVGLLLMAFSMSMPEASVTLCCLLLALQLIQPVRFLWHRGELSSSALSDLVSESPGAVRGKPAMWSRPPASRFRPGTASDESGTEPLYEEADESTELSDSEEEGGAQPSEQAFAQAAHVPLPEESSGQAPGTASKQRRGLGSPTPAAMPLGTDARDSPWLKQGMALNMQTGRTVKMGGSTWNKLVLQGYQLDRQQGTFTPPKSAKSRENGSDSRTPASRVKARRSPS